MTVSLASRRFPTTIVISVAIWKSNEQWWIKFDPLMSFTLNFYHDYVKLFFCNGYYNMNNADGRDTLYTCMCLFIWLCNTIMMDTCNYKRGKIINENSFFYSYHKYQYNPTYVRWYFIRMNNVHILVILSLRSLTDETFDSILYVVQ